MNERTVKKADVSDEDKMKILAAMLVAGGGAAGLGAIIRNVAAKKKRAKSRDTERSKNAIIVPVKKTKFLEGLPTPQELAESRGETSASRPAIGMDAPAPALPAPAESIAPEVVEMSPEEIAAKKKEILRANSRKFDFFGKAAHCKQADVGDVLKEIGQIFTQPVESGKRFWDSATGKPVLVSAGLLGSIYLAARLTDAINARRRDRSRKELDDARSEYVELLEGNEKAADGGVVDGAGVLLGSAYFIPLALSALVTSKIIDNRKREKAKKEEMSDSYPDEPIILYKTSEAREVPMSAPAAIAFIALNREIIKSAELDERNGFSKSAQARDYGPAIAEIRRFAADPSNSDIVAKLVQAKYEGDNGAVADAGKELFWNYAKSLGVDEKAIEEYRKTGRSDGLISSGMEAIGKNGDRLAAILPALSSPEAQLGLYNALAMDKGFREDVAGRFDSDPAFRAVRDRIVDNEMQNSWFGRTFKKDGLIGSAAWGLAKWLGDVTGYTKKRFNEGLNAVFDSYGKRRDLPTFSPQDVFEMGRQLAGRQPAGGQQQVQTTRRRPKAEFLGQQSPVVPQAGHDVRGAAFGSDGTPISVDEGQQTPTSANDVA